MVQRKHVDEAIKKRIYRSNLIEERVKEVIEKDIIWVETEGEKVGQVNGLAVLMTGDHVFGKTEPDHGHRFGRARGDGVHRP